VLAASLAAALVAVVQSSPVSVAIAIGDPAPALEAVTPDGESVGGGWWSGDANVVAFFATWCKPCHRALRELVAIRQLLGPRLRFVLIEAGDDPSEVRQFLAANPVPEGAVVTTDLSGTARQRWGCNAYPTLFIVDRTGVVRYINHGWGEGSQAKYLRRIHAVLGDAPPSGPDKARSSARSSVAPAQPERPPRHEVVKGVEILRGP
jgi:cytochrome c biogenesis protein CcmG/thiol:disulfide interchange protein DsbE